MTKDKATPKATPKAGPKATPKATPKAGPKEARKVSRTPTPKETPKAGRKATPKTTPKAGRKATRPKATRKATPKEAPKATRKEGPKEGQFTPDSFRALETKGLKDLSQADLLKIKIIIFFTDRPQASEKEAMLHFNVSLPTIQRAKAWGREKGLYEWESLGLLKMALIRLNRLIDVVQDSLNHVLKYNDHQAIENKPGNPLAVGHLAGRLESLYIRWAELQGIYNTKIKIDFEAGEKSSINQLIAKFDSIGMSEEMEENV